MLSFCEPLKTHLRTQKHNRLTSVELNVDADEVTDLSVSHFHLVNKWQPWHMLTSISLSKKTLSPTNEHKGTKMHRETWTDMMSHSWSPFLYLQIHLFSLIIRCFKRWRKVNRFVCFFLLCSDLHFSSHPEKSGFNDKQITKDKVACAIAVFIPRGPVRKHPALTPGTPTAPWLCSTPGRG